MILVDYVDQGGGKSDRAAGVAIDRHGRILVVHANSAIVTLVLLFFLALESKSWDLIQRLFQHSKGIGNTKAFCCFRLTSS